NTIKYSRVCFNLMAGELAVKISKKFIDLNYIIVTGKSLILSKKGFNELFKLGFILLKNLDGELCYDWSFKDYHISGKLGKFLLENFLINNYIIQKENPRELKLTNAGKVFIKKNFEI
ncbi:MAG: hypothetical protein ACRDCW_17115, partial [Sarcina sp.]